LNTRTLPFGARKLITNRPKLRFKFLLKTSTYRNNIADNL